MQRDEDIADNSPLSRQGRRAAESQDDAAARLREATERASENVAAYRDQAQERADAAIETAAEGMGEASTIVRERGHDAGGVVENAAEKTADTIEQASQKLHEYDTNRIVREAGEYVRRHPLQAAIGAAFGIFFVAALLRGDSPDE